MKRFIILLCAFIIYYHQTNCQHLYYDALNEEDYYLDGYNSCEECTWVTFVGEKFMNAGYYLAPYNEEITKNGDIGDAIDGSDISITMAADDLWGNYLIIWESRNVEFYGDAYICPQYDKTEQDVGEWLKASLAFINLSGQEVAKPYLYFKVGTKRDITLDCEITQTNEKAVARNTLRLLPGFLCNKTGFQAYLNPSGPKSAEVYDNNNFSQKPIVQLDNTVKVFPNPNNGIFTINGKSLSEDKSVIISIKNFMGIEVYNGILSSDENTIDLSDQSKGVYFVIIKTENNIIKKNVIIQ